jgi:hypothetical protein
MIKTYEQFKNDNEIIIELLVDSGLEFVDIIKEEFAYFHYTKDNKEKLPVSWEYKEKFKILENKINNYLYEVNPFMGEYENRMIEFNINSTEHWITKFHRKEFEDPQGNRDMINPNLQEGINLIVNNSNLLAKYLVSGYIKHNDYVIIRTKDLSRYNEITYFDKIKSNRYDIKLITQMKGDFRFDKGKIIKLHPNGPK